MFVDRSAQEIVVVPRSCTGEIFHAPAEASDRYGMSSNAVQCDGRTTVKSRWFKVASVVTFNRSAMATIAASTRPSPSVS